MNRRWLLDDAVTAGLLVQSVNVFRVCWAVILLGVSAAWAGGPPIKTQQCNVSPTGQFVIPGDIALFVANRNSTVTTYTSPPTLENPLGWLTGAPVLNLGGTATGLSLVSKNNHVGVARDLEEHLYVVNPGLQTVTIYKVGATINARPLATIPQSAGLSQPSGLAIDDTNGGYVLVYVANAGNSTISAYRVTFGTSAGAETADYTRLTLPTPAGLSAPLGLALSSLGNTLYVANKGSNQIGVYAVSLAANVVTLNPVSSPTLASLSGPIAVALSPSGNVLYVANNGKYNGWYNVTAYRLSTAGVPQAQPAAVIAGSSTGLCNPAALAADRSMVSGEPEDFLAVANRESSGGSITFYRLDSEGLPAGPPVAPADPTNIPPAVMMLHDSINLLAAPVGISF